MSFRVGSALRYEFGTARIHLSFNSLARLAADFISIDYPHLRHITECGADLVIDQDPRCVERLCCIVPKRGLFAVQVFRSGIHRGQNGEVRMLTVAEYVQNYPSALSVAVPAAVRCCAGPTRRRPRPNHYLVPAPELDLCVFVP